MTHPQLPLRLPPVAPDQRLTAFVGSEAACRLLAAAARGEHNDWLYLCGPAGSGKTHLLLAVVAEAQAAGRDVRYLPLNAFAGSLDVALQGQEHGDLVCVDALDAIADSAADQEALFHFHNRARAAGSQLIYAARAAPTLALWSLPDLVSRLSQCSRAYLPLLDDEGRRELLSRRAALRGMVLEPAVLDFVLRRVGRDLASLTELLDRIDQASLAAKRRVTLALVRAIVEQT
ncbi:MAG: DnaA regulatory inactivator Hda [Xanthomonadaceae bacterium]|nr:DnaA regulatory inactivator Hda [Xanthomonadaceae bacterium]MDP2186315.1 DnaA regulatory inactivator Hda [Xanthomonadales bacterium]MDZ4115736.1 DnaA regulatory inactivator Hda [Xanthomonadaceae bacterium]MDZ4379360.1 DnaA regulatory inactivator Hda [Xanthomonadaceae bacterium]